MTLEVAQARTVAVYTATHYTNAVDDVLVAPDDFRTPTFADRMPKAEHLS
jgi:hypothetical protein